MSKRVNIMVAVLALAVAIPAGGIFYVQNTVEKNITTILQQNNITAQSVSYSLLEDTIKIQNLNAPMPYVSSGTISIGSLTALSPNEEAFNPQAVGYPLVAEKIQLSDIKTEYTIQGEKSTSHTESIHIINWKQNLGKALAAAQQGTTKDFFAAFMDMYIQSIEMDSMHSLSTMQGLSIKSTLQKYTVSGISPQEVASYAATNIESIAQQQDAIFSHTRLAGLEMRSVDMPSAELMATLWQAALQGGEITEATEANVIKEIQNYFANGVKSGMTLDGLQILGTEKGREKPVVSIAQLFIEANYDAVQASELAFTLNVKDLSINREDLNIDRFSKILHEVLGSSDITLNTALQGNIHTKPKLSTLDLNLGVKNLAHTQMQWSVSFPIEKFTSLLTLKNQDYQKFLMQIGIKNFAINYTDEGLLPRMLIHYGKLTHASLDDVHALISPMLDKELAALDKLINKEKQLAIKQCLLNPGTLHMALDMPEATPLLMLSVIALSQPQSLPITISCKPGPAVLETAKKLVQP